MRKVTGLIFLSFVLMIVSCSKRPKIPLSAFPAEKLVTAIDSDSIRVQELLLFALNKVKSANGHITDFDSDSLSIQSGHLFSGTDEHLIIRIRTYETKETFIYLKQDTNYTQVVDHSDGSMTYIEDTIQEINGDHHLDFVTHSYSLNGCCERYAYDVYLSKNDGTFSNDAELLNADFYPKEHLIRGKCYGHAAPFYKFKWNNQYSLDTIEFIFPSDIYDKFTDYCIKKTVNDVDAPGDTLMELPAEYQNLDFEF